MANPYLGEIRIFGFNFAPVGWALCNGQLLAINQNQALFSLLGTTYGGNGTTTFALPDLQSRVPLHFGTGSGLSPYVQGETAGSETQTIGVNQLPAHNHAITLGTTAATLNVKNGAGNAQSPAANVPATEAAGVTATYSNQAPDATMAPAAITLSGAPVSANAGGGQPLDIRQPVLAVNFCIALQGIFPSRA